MKNNYKIQIICPEHKKLLKINGSGDSYLCPIGCSYPIIGGIPRFVQKNNYASSFGLQWNKFKTTQLDSCNGLTISRDRLERIAGGSLELFRNKIVLEAGCGAGRFTEVMLSVGARVFAIDISNAVEANFNNCKNFSKYYVCQADIMKLPVQKEIFDIVVCIGVIQHTPDPEKTMSKLCSFLKPGGILLIDHYTYGYPITPTRKLIRNYLLKKSPTFSMIFTQSFVTVLWPLHLVLWKLKKLRFMNYFRLKLLSFSPVVDYHDSYPQLKKGLMYKWAVLDTHDTLTDRYKHLRGAEEIKRYLTLCGMIKIITKYAGNGVEVSAQKPDER